jgi:trimeric autotransporter adhesin
MSPSTAWGGARNDPFVIYSVTDVAGLTNHPHMKTSYFATLITVTLLSVLPTVAHAQLYNTTLGINTLASDTTGNYNLAIGTNSLFLNTTGNDNTTNGLSCMYLNTTGSDNTAIGFAVLLNNTTASYNSGFGLEALYNNTTGSYNTASGFYAMYTNYTGIQNTASGSLALLNSTTGNFNTGCGFESLLSNTTGSSNTALGYLADVGSGALTNSTVIGANAKVTTSNTIQLGNSSITTLNCKVALTVTSDRTKKENFLPVDGAEVLRKIRGFDLPSWNFIGQDKKTMRHYGPMAQDFYAAFGHDAIGSSGNDTTINSGDLAGITLIAVQELSAEGVTMKEENSVLKSKNAALEKRVTELEAKNQQQMSDLQARLAKLEQFVPSAPKAGTTTADATR